MSKSPGGAGMRGACGPGMAYAARQDGRVRMKASACMPTMVDGRRARRLVMAACVARIA
ncbi:hypothetical protein AB4851_05185 [Burkholderia sp. 22PA0099]|uniref:hypothetical protein n=1 Tax=Burkholderia sp. 22PA0099 TaxID=3237372 RepID=UPI0039C38DC3